MQSKSAVFALALLVAQSGFSQTFPVDTLQYNGDADHLINLVVLGDGYRAPELGQFAQNAAAFVENLFAEMPYQAYRSYFNVFLIPTPSNVTGAALNPDSLIDNYYGSTYWYAGIERLLVATRTSKVIGVLSNNFPNYDQVFMLVNHVKYGGSGGWVATASLHSLSSEIAIHEIGHSFAGLKDEYWAGDGFAAERANMTREIDPDAVKWKNWFNTNGVALYQHCCGGASGQWYRPHENCKMRYLERPFCPVCREQTVESIHGKAGTPIAGFGPANGANFSPDSLPLKFAVQLLQPQPNTLRTAWTLNGQTLAQQTDSLWLQANPLQPGLNQLTFWVEDTTALLRVNNHSNLHLYTVSWTIDNSASGIRRLAAAPGHLQLRCTPNPLGEQAQLLLETAVAGQFRAVVYDVSGAVVYESELATGSAKLVETAGWPSGVFALVLFSGQVPVASGQLVKI